MKSNRAMSRAKLLTYKNGKWAGEVHLHHEAGAHVTRAVTLAGVSELAPGRVSSGGYAFAGFRVQIAPVVTHPEPAGRATVIHMRICGSRNKFQIGGRSALAYA